MSGSTYGIPALQDQVKRFARTAGIAAPIEFGTIITRYKKATTVHRGQLARLQNDPKVPPLIFPPIPDAVRLAGGLEGHYSSLKGKYTRQLFDGLFELTEAFRQRIEEGE